MYLIVFWINGGFTFKPVINKKFMRHSHLLHCRCTLYWILKNFQSGMLILHLCQAAMEQKICWNSRKFWHPRNEIASRDKEFDISVATLERVAIDNQKIHSSNGWVWALPQHEDKNYSSLQVHPAGGRRRNWMLGVEMTSRFSASQPIVTPALVGIHFNWNCRQFLTLHLHHEGDAFGWGFHVQWKCHQVVRGLWWFPMKFPDFKRPWYQKIPNTVVIPYFVGDEFSLVATALVPSTDPPPPRICLHHVHWKPQGDGLKNPCLVPLVSSVPLPWASFIMLSLNLVTFAMDPHNFSMKNVQ